MTPSGRLRSRLSSLVLIVEETPVTPVRASMKKDLNALFELMRESASEWLLVLASEWVDCGEVESAAQSSVVSIEMDDSEGSDMLRLEAGD